MCAYVPRGKFQSHPLLQPCEITKVHSPPPRLPNSNRFKSRARQPTKTHNCANLDGIESSPMKSIYTRWKSQAHSGGGRSAHKYQGNPYPLRKFKEVQNEKRIQGRKGIGEDFAACLLFAFRSQRCCHWVGCEGTLRREIRVVPRHSMPVSSFCSF